MRIPKSTIPVKTPADARARQAQGLKLVIAFLLVSAVVFGAFVTALPLPVRLFVAATDLIIAAVLGLVLRQKFRK